MTFRDYLAVSRPDLARIPPVHPAALQTQAVAAQLTAVQFDVDAYDLAWQDYLTCGGFPRAVSEHARSGAVSGAYLRDIEAWLRADIDPDAPAESIPNLLAGLASRSTSPLNATATARDLGYATRDIFERRMSRLVTSFAVLACPQRDERGRSVYGAQSKWYLTDPILSWLPSRLRAGLPEPDMTRLTESTIAVALARAVDGLEEGRWTAADTIGYLRTGSGGEIDLAPVNVPTPSGPAMTTPIEGKWVDHGWRSEARTIEAKFGYGLLATKSILDPNQPSWAVPAPLLALLLNL